MTFTFLSIHRKHPGTNRTNRITKERDLSDAPEFIYARPIGATVDWTGSTSGPWALDDPHNTATEYVRADRVRVTGFEDAPQWLPIETAYPNDLDKALLWDDGNPVVGEYFAGPGQW